MNVWKARFSVILFYYFTCYYYFNLVDADYVQRNFINSILRLPGDKLYDDSAIDLIVPDESAKFFLIGDWGGVQWFPYRTFAQQRVASSMARQAKKYRTHFQISLGDNIYYEGVQNASDKRFQATFESVYASKNLKQTPWFQVLGNHDHLGNASAQIEYTKLSKRWILPNYNYTLNIKTRNGTVNLIRFIMIDTILLCGNSRPGLNKDKLENDYAKLKFATEKDRLRAKEYFKDLRKKLKAASESTYKYKIVVGHFPIWSVAEHGPTRCLVDKLRPLLHEHNMNAYFCGHEHDMEFIREPNMKYLNTSIDYVVNGAGSSVFNSQANKDKIPANSLKFYWASDLQLNGAYNYLEANLTSFSIKFIRSDDKILHETMLNG